MPYIMIPSGYYALVSNFGRIMDYPGDAENRSVSPLWPAGFHWANPMTQVDFLITKQSIFFDAPVRDVYTRDNIGVSIDIAVVFKVNGDQPELVKDLALTQQPNALETNLRATIDETVKNAARRLKHIEVYGLGTDPLVVADDADEDDEKDEVAASTKGESIRESMKRSLNENFGEKLGIVIQEVIIKNVKLPTDVQDNLASKTKVDSKMAEDRMKQHYTMAKQSTEDEMEKIQQKVQLDIESSKARLEKEYTDKKITLSNAKAKGDKECNMLLREMTNTIEMTEAKTAALVSRSDQNCEATRAEFECLAANDAKKLETSVNAAIETQLAEARLEVAKFDAQASMLLSNAEGEIAKMVAVRKQHETQVKKLEIYEQLANNKDLVIIPSNDSDVAQLLIADEILSKNQGRETRSTFLAEMIAMQKGNKSIMLNMDK